MAWNSTIKQKKGICQGDLCRDDEHRGEVFLSHVKKELCPKCNNHEKTKEYAEKRENSSVPGPQPGQKQSKKSYTIPKISSKQIKGLSKYRTNRDKYLEENQVCECEDCNKPSTHVHHKKGRAGKLLYDWEFFMAVCGYCHPRKIHETHTEWAKEKGYLLNRNK